MRSLPLPPSEHARALTTHSPPALDVQLALCVTCVSQWAAAPHLDALQQLTRQPLPHCVRLDQRKRGAASATAAAAARGNGAASRPEKEAQLARSGLWGVRAVRSIVQRIAPEGSPVMHKSGMGTGTRMRVGAATVSMVVHRL
jgi:hypothetical protein